MPNSDELAFMDATSLAELVRKGDASPLELVDSAIERIERLNPALNAVITPMYDEARKAAQSNIPDGPFKGVPFVLKDLVALYGGVPCQSGSAAMQGFVPDHDSDLVSRFKAAGFICVGKTNTPEFGLMATTEPKAFGPTRNPWNTDLTPGGSSGGTAAAVASGMVPLGHGNDGGGSIRIPSSCCGLFGLKPTRGRNPLGPDLGDMMSGLVCEHVLTRSVRDSASVLDLTRGASKGAPYVAPEPKKPYLQEAVAQPGKLRIAFSTKAATGVPVHPECASAVTETMKLCESLGHTVEEADPAIDGDRFSQAFIGLWAGGCAWTINSLPYITGNAVEKEQFEPLTWGLHEMGLALNAPDYLLAVSYMQQCGFVLANFFDSYDVWVTPSLAQPPVALGTLPSPPDNPLHGLFASATFVPFTPLANATGVPAMSVPMHWSADNLPIGVHVTAPYGGEDVLFRLAGQLEQARPWADRRPPVS